MLLLDIMVEKNIPLEDKYLGKYVNATIEDVSLNVMISSGGLLHYLSFYEF